MTNTTKKIHEEKTEFFEMNGDNRNFRAFLETIDDVVVVGDTQGKILYANPATSTKLGYSMEEILKMEVIDLNTRASRKEAEVIFRDMIAGKRNHCPLSLERKDGSYIPVETSIWMGKWDGQDCLFGISKDLSAQQAAFDRFVKIFNNNPALMAISSSETGKFLEINEAFINKLGYSREEIIGKTSEDLGLFPNISDREKSAKLLKEQGRLREIEIEVVGKNGVKMDGLFSGEIIDDQMKKSFLTVMMDITAQKKSEKLLAKQTGLLQSLLDSIDDLVFYKDLEGHYLGCNPRYAQFTGKSPQDILGKTALSLYDKKLADSLMEVDKIVLETRTPQHTEAWMTYPDGRKVFLSTMKSPYFDTEGRLIGLIGVSRDITEQKMKESENEFLSFHDQLTGLYNLRFFEEELHRMDVERNLPLSIIFGDVNGLKFTNDSFGHAMGDELLVKTADALRRGCRKEDVSARTGGDEFALILPKTSSSVAEEVIARIQRHLSIELVCGLEVSVSFGVATKTEFAQSTNQILKEAEDRMYENKLAGRMSTRRKAIESILKMLDRKSPREALHGQNVGRIAEVLAIKAGLHPDLVKDVKMAGQMHDIGKYAFDANLLNSPFPLTPSERIEMEKHPETGFRVLSSIYEMSKIAVYALEHHERWDGKGYPKGLQGERISLPGRILAVAEAFDVMTTKQPYREAISHQEALEELQKQAGTQFDPNVVRLLMESQSLL